METDHKYREQGGARPSLQINLTLKPDEPTDSIETLRAINDIPEESWAQKTVMNFLMESHSEASITFEIYRYTSMETTEEIHTSID